MKTRLPDLVGNVRSDAREGVASAGFIAAVSAVADLVVPLTVAFAIAAITSGTDLAMAFGAPVVGVLLSAVLAGARVRLLSRIAARQMRFLRTEIASRLLALGPRSVEQLGVDEGVHVLSQYSGELEALLSAERIRRWVAACTALGCVVLMFVFEWQLACALVVVLAICAALVSLALRPVKRRATVGMTALSRVAGEVGEFLRSVRSATVFGLKEKYVSRVSEDLIAVERAERDIGSAQATVDFIIKSTLTLSLLGLGVIGALLVAGGQTSAVQLGGFLGALGILLAPVAQYAELMQRRARGVAALERLELLDGDGPSAGASTGTGVASTAAGSAAGTGIIMALRVIDAVVEPAPNVTVGPISFDARPGTLVCVAGPSGSGKSSFLSALARFLPLSAGEIRVNKILIREWDPPALWRNIAFVEQGTPIVGSTFRDFLTPGDRALDDVHAFAVLNRLGLSGRLSAAALDTPIERMGTSLSGGEKQRLSIARAVCSDRPVLLLDEPTSNLDAESERAVVELLEELKHSHTVLVASHSALVIDRADVVVKLMPAPERMSPSLVGK